jgi:hypothetical protein
MTRVAMLYEQQPEYAENYDWFLRLYDAFMIAIHYPIGLTKRWSERRIVVLKAEGKIMKDEVKAELDLGRGSLALSR